MYAPGLKKASPGRARGRAPRRRSRSPAGPRLGEEAVLDVAELFRGGPLPMLGSRAPRWSGHRGCHGRYRSFRIQELGGHPPALRHSEAHVVRGRRRRAAAARGAAPSRGGADVYAPDDHLGRRAARVRRADPAWAAVAGRARRARAIRSRTRALAWLRAVAVGDALLGRTAGTACAVDFSPWIVESEPYGTHAVAHDT